MALSDIKFANLKRRHRVPLGTIKPSRQIMRTNLAVSPTGAAIAIRPHVTALRRMNDKGQGEVGYV